MVSEAFHGRHSLVTKCLSTCSNSRWDEQEGSARVIVCFCYVPIVLFGLAVEDGRISADLHYMSRSLCSLLLDILKTNSTSFLLV